MADEYPPETRIGEAVADTRHVGVNEAHDAASPEVGDGAAGTLAFVNQPAPGFVNSDPLRTTLLPIALAAFVAAAQAFIDGAEVRGIITAVLGALIVAAQELARSKVTPLADPKIDAEVRLVPES